MIVFREKRGFYRLGRVKNCHIRNDCNIRSCDVLTQSGLVSRLTIELFCVFGDNGCVPPQEKHRAGDEKSKN